MCGIAGFNLAPGENINATSLAAGLLSRIEHRGRHATGAAWFTPADGAFIDKSPVPARTFVKTLNVPATATNVLLHTRFGTQGSPLKPENNHPIDARGTVGIHNGVIFNDDQMWDLIGQGRRYAEVDSEVIFAAIQLSRENNQDLADVLAWTEGSSAIAWFHTDTTDVDTMFLARVSSSPLYYAISETGSVVFASEASAITSSAREVGMRLAIDPRPMSEGMCFEIRAGRIVRKITFGDYTKRSERELTYTERQALNLT
ncbi:MAG: class II glutamine amidotransferase [Propionicimonas sp.]